MPTIINELPGPVHIAWMLHGRVQILLKPRKVKKVGQAYSQKITEMINAGPRFASRFSTMSPTLTLEWAVRLSQIGTPANDNRHT